MIMFSTGVHLKEATDAINKLVDESIGKPVTDLRCSFTRHLAKEHLFAMLAYLYLWG